MLNTPLALLLLSTAVAAGEDAPLPVFVLAGQSNMDGAGQVAELPAELHRVLVALEGTPRNARRLKRTIEVAQGAGLELVVVHVDDETSIPSFSDQVQHETEAYAHEFLARFAPGSHAARLELRIGAPADEILTAADASSPDLLAIGWPQSNDPARGVVAREVLDRSHRPV